LIDDYHYEKKTEVMPQATKWNKDKPHPGFETYQDGFEGVEGLGKYERVAPDNF